MREIIKLTLELALIAAICAGLLSFASVKTQSARNGLAAKKRVDAATAVLPSGSNTPEQDEIDDVPVFVVRDASGALSAAAVECSSPNGYGGEIRLMIGFNAKGEVLDFKVLSASETPGLGSKITSDSFRGGIVGKNTSTDWRVKKDGGDIDAVTSATISSRAVCEAISDAVRTFEKIGH